MNIAYVKIRKMKEKTRQNYIGNLLENIKLDIKRLLNIVEQEKYNQDIFYLNNLSEVSKRKLINNLLTQKFDCAIMEGDNQLDYPTLDGKYIMRAMIPELVDYCYNAIRPERDEVYVCTEVFSFENVSIIEELTRRVKVVNVVTNHRRFRNLEKRLEENDIFITVSGNKRQSLKKASIVVNLDLPDLNQYNINRDIVIIDATSKISLAKSFNGIVIRKASVNTKKVMRIFSEFEGFSKQKLIEAELSKINDYQRTREFINFNKIYLDRLYNNSPINPQEFMRLRKKSSKK